MPVKYKTKNYDLLGVTAAFLCLVHCMVLPLLIFIPLGIAHNSYIDILFLLPGIWSVYKTTKHSDSAIVAGLLWVSVALIALSILLHMLFHWHTPLVYIGAVGLIAGHLINFRQHKTRHTNDKSEITCNRT